MVLGVGSLPVWSLALVLFQCGFFSAGRVSVVSVPLAKLAKCELKPDLSSVTVLYNTTVLSVYGLLGLHGAPGPWAYWAGAGPGYRGASEAKA